MGLLVSFVDGNDHEERLRNAQRGSGRMAIVASDVRPPSVESALVKKGSGASNAARLRSCTQGLHAAGRDGRAALLEQRLAQLLRERRIHPRAAEIAGAEPQTSTSMQSTSFEVVRR